MADGRIVIDTEVNEDGAQRGLSNLRRSIQGVEDSANKSNSRLSAVSSTLAKGAEAATKAIAGVGEYSIQSGMSFESAMHQVGATLKMTADQCNNNNETYKRLSDTAKEMGSNTKYSATEAAQALNMLAMAGYDTNKSIDTLPSTLNFASASNMDLARATEVVVAGYNVWQDKVKNVDEVTDKLARTAQSTKTDVSQLADGLLTVGGTATELSGGLTEASVALGIFADRQIMGAEGGTALRNIILSLSAPTDKAAKTMRDLGISAFDSNGNLRPLNETFKDLDKVLGGMSSQKRTQVLNELFNKVDLKAVNALLDNCGDRFDELTEAVDNSSGACKSMADTMNDTLEGRLKSIQSNLESVGIAIYEQMEEPLKSAADKGIECLSQLGESLQSGQLNESLGKLAESFGSLIERLANGLADHLPEIINFLTFLMDNAGTIAVLVTTIGVAFKAWEVFNTIREIVTVMKEMEVVTKLVTVAQTALNAVMALNPIMLIVMAVIALIGVFVLLYAKCEPFRNWCNGLWEDLKKLGSMIMDFFCTTVPNAFSSAIDAIGQFFSDMGSSIAGFFTDTIPNFFISLWQKIVSIWNSITEAFSAGVNAIITFFTETIPSAIMAFPEFLNGVIDRIIEITSNFIGTILGNIILCVMNIWNFITVTIPQIVNEVITYISQLPARVWEWLVNTYNKVTEWALNMWNTAIEVGSNFINSILQWFSQLPANIWNWLVNTYTNVTTWASNMWNKAKEVGINFVTSVVNFIQQLPSRVWNWLVSTIQKVAQFASDMASKARQAGSNMVNNVINAIKSLPSKVANVGRNIVQGLWNGITGMGSWLYNKAASFAKGVLSSMKRALGIHSPSKVFKDEVGKFIAQGIGEGFTDESQNTNRKMNKAVTENVNKMQATVNGEITGIKAVPNFQTNIDMQGIINTLGNLTEKIENHIHLEVEGKEIAYAVAPYQTVLSDYYKGR